MDTAVGLIVAAEVDPANHHTPWRGGFADGADHGLASAGDRDLARTADIDADEFAHGTQSSKLDRRTRVAAVVARAREDAPEHSRALS